MGRAVVLRCEGSKGRSGKALREVLQEGGATEPVRGFFLWSRARQLNKKEEKKEEGKRGNRRFFILVSFLLY